jgi:two-component system, chemotaxis family, protein-glutamate methylesterase/glutaminase
VSNRDMIVIGASAGGVEALQVICAGLPADLDAAILVVLHSSPSSGGLLPQILSRAGLLPAVHPTENERVKKGRIYVAPPDCHMIVNGGRIILTRGPRENRHRPAIDPLFRSAALFYGARTIGVILTGMLDDGTSGLMVVEARRGFTIVQDPASAMFPPMPENALERVPGARVARLEDIPSLLAELVRTPLAPGLAGSSAEGGVEGEEVRLAEIDMSEIEKEIPFGDPSPFSCPECGGVLWEIDQEGLLRYRCRVGHAYTAKHLNLEQSIKIEAALWAGLRALEESASLYRRMAVRARDANLNEPENTYETRASDIEDHSKALRDLLLRVNTANSSREKEAPRIAS